MTAGLARIPRSSSTGRSPKDPSVWTPKRASEAAVPGRQYYPAGSQCGAGRRVAGCRAQEVFGEAVRDRAEVLLPTSGSARLGRGRPGCTRPRSGAASRPGLVERSSDADLLVRDRQGRGGFHRADARSGDVTHAVVLHATRPMVAVPPGNEGDRPAATLGADVNRGSGTLSWSTVPGPGSERRWRRPDRQPLAPRGHRMDARPARLMLADHGSMVTGRPVAVCHSAVRVAQPGVGTAAAGE